MKTNSIVRLALIALLSPLSLSVVAPAPLAAQQAHADTVSAAMRVRGDTLRARGLAPVAVVGRIDQLIGIASSASEGRIGAVDLRARPISRQGELLETVPGLIATQHSGEGKANQYFLRGFNLDHGTDFRTMVEGMPVNLPTHGHGQGYTDINFVIPELIDHLEYRLGVQHAAVGDFGSAGGAAFSLVKSLPRPFATIETGAYDMLRAAVGTSRKVGAGELLLAGEGERYDGPWVVPEGVRKGNFFARYSWTRGTDRFDVMAMGYRNRWRAADQVPLRAVEAGTLDRFGQVDTSDAGRSARWSLSAAWHRLGANTLREAQLFAIRSDLDLWSNFTYFLDDPVRGDQFQQVDRRTIVGGRLTQRQAITVAGAPTTLSSGIETRADVIGEVGLFRTQARRRFATVRDDDVLQTGTGAFAELDTRWRPWLRSVLGARVDGYTFRVASDRAENSGRRAAAIASPKASVIVTPSEWSELYVSGGTGFHSNDARGTTIRVDPVSGDPVSRVDPIVRSVGGEVGLRLSPLRGLRTTLALWTLGLDSELLFVGDAGATEASAASRRTGVTLASFWRPIPVLAFESDLSLARARLRGVAAGEDHIPGALERVFAGGVSWSPAVAGAFAAVRVRHFGDYPLIEDNSVRARASTLVNADAGWRLPSGIELRVTLLNVLNTRASDIQYYYESRLRGEGSEGTSDVHVHPAEPRQLRVQLGWRR